MTFEVLEENILDNPNIPWTDVNVFLGGYLDGNLGVNLEICFFDI